MVDIVTRAGKGSPLTNNEVDANFTNLAEVAGVTGEPMGHEDRTTSTISFNASTRTFTIAPVSTSFTVWCKGKKVVVSSAQTVTIPNTTGMYSIYYDANGVLAAKAGYFTFSVEAPTAYVYWNAEAGTCPYFGDERHGVVLDWQTHEYLHRTRGAALASGFGASGYTLGGNGSSNAHAQLTLEGGTFFDEDMKIIVTATNTPTAGTWEQDLLSPARIPVLYLSGTGWVIDAPTDYPLKQGTARPRYNAYSAGVWSTADVANNKYATSWILATNNLTYPVIAIIGQAESDLQSAAEAVDFTSLQLPGFPSVEFRPLYRLVFQCADSFSNAVKASLVSITDIRSIAAAGVAASLITDHGNLSGLSDDDHPQYLSVDTVRSTLTAAVKASFLPSQTGNAGKFLTTDATSTSWAALTSGNITTALGFTPYNATNPAGYITGITSSDVTTALGFTPYNATNPSGYVTAAGARGAISVTGAGSYDSATGVINIVGGVTSFNTRTGAITLSSADVTTALGFTPYNSTNPNGYLTGITSTQVTTALGYTPYNSSNPSGYISGITSGMVTTALGFTPYNNSNPSGYITSSALSGYLTSASAASTYAPLTGTGASGTWGISVTGNSATVAGLSPAQFFNNMGNNHSTYTDFNNVPGFGAYYVQQGGNSPTGVAANQWYGFTLGLGNDYGLSLYGTQIYWPRRAQNGDTYIYIRDREGGSWTSWTKIKAGYADSAGSATDSSKLPLSGGSVSGNVNIGSSAIPVATLDVRGGVSVSGWSNNNSGSAGGVEFGWDGTQSLLQSYDRVNSVYKPIGLNGSYTTIVNSTRSPIYYDSSNTGYYVDPASSSQLNTVSLGAGSKLHLVSLGDGNHFLRYVGSGFSGVTIDGPQLGGHQGGELITNNGGDNWSFRWNRDGNTFTRISSRAPIFYDQDNTGYYIDANGVSNVSSLYGEDSLVRIQKVHSEGGEIRFLNTAQTTGGWIQGHDGGLRTVDHGWTQTTWNIDNAGNSVATASHRAPIFYDSNDTGYYTDPNGGSRMNSLSLNTVSVTAGVTSLTNAPIATQQVNVGTTSTWLPMTYQRALHNSGYITHLNTGLYKNASGWGDNSTGWYAALGGSDSYPTMEWRLTYGTYIYNSNGYVSAYGSLRSPIFYDSDDTAYYVNPNSGTNLAGDIRADQVYTRNWFRNDASNTGLYSQPHDNHWYASSSSTWNVGGTNGSNCAIALRPQGHQSTVRGYFYADTGNSVGFLNQDGSWRVRVAGGDYTEISGSSIRAYFYYDLNNTSYYVDPTDTSNMSKVFAQNYFCGGSNGYGWYKGYDNNNHFISIRGAVSGSTTSLSITGAHQTTLVEHCSPADTSTGWFFKDSYSGGNYNYQTVARISRNNSWFEGALYGDSSVRAPVFYDSNDTAYYCDPASFTYVKGGIANNGEHGSSYIYNRLLAANNGAQTGEVRVQMWCSEPGNTWDYGGFGYNVDNGSNSNSPVYYFGRPNPNFGQAYMRFSTGGEWYFYNTNTTPTRYLTMQLTSSGYVIAYQSMRAPIFYDQDDTTYFADLNSTSTSIRAAGNITAYYSDMRLKTHLGKIDNAREKVRQLEGFYYEANELAQKFGYKPKREVGVSAQAVQAVLPEIVTDAPINSNYLTIDYERLTPLLIEAIKEQDTELVDLRNRVAQLESLITKLIGD